MPTKSSDNVEVKGRSGADGCVMLSENEMNQIAPVRKFSVALHSYQLQKHAITVPHLESGEKY